MPIELRNLLFTKGEMVRAVVEYYKRMGSPLPTGDIGTFRVAEKDGALSLFIEITRGASASVYDVLIDEETLLSALILYCKYRKIPLPADALKQLLAVHGTVVMAMSRNIEPKHARPMQEAIIGKLSAREFATKADTNTASAVG